MGTLTLLAYNPSTTTGTLNVFRGSITALVDEGQSRALLHVGLGTGLQPASVCIAVAELKVKDDI